ncbi:MAG: 16S rRNA (cytosine(1402)-N(4))-methyltransferase RsmH [Bifidobacteriaceae bacterium]|jgi:16S rRNA (cytosine1402-N4)-methyltransferase|nr:16S rRNA (cytosine(1402)-N(4))-methyltransferase RsmH [Bifidobacteriaceae bacterium]
MKFKHIPVKLEDTIIIAANSVKSFCNKHNINADDCLIIDATVGLGGHSLKMLEAISDVKIVGIDRDPTAIKIASERCENYKNRICFFESTFDNLEGARDFAREYFNNKKLQIALIVFDFGVSSMQLDDGDRGFSYNKDARLDMRMDSSSELSAYEVVNNYSQTELVEIFRKYSDEKYANYIAKQIITDRLAAPINTTLQLADTIKKALPIKLQYTNYISSQKRIFQAIRIEVNNELGCIEDALDSLFSVANSGTNVIFMSYQSLEDKLVKSFIKTNSELSADLAHLPIVPDALLPKLIDLTKKSQKLASKSEESENSRSHSVRYRVCEFS